jgi:hypothetical protein
LVQDGEPVDIVRQCTIETSPDRSRCPPSEKRCDIGTRLYAGKCPDPNEQRARTAVGQAEDGQLIVLAVPETHGLTLYQLRDTFIRLGAVQAMNLDGGRSTQLWYDGDYVVTPTRPVASALLVFAQPRPPLAPPGGLFAVPVDGVSIRLTWTDNSANEDGFRIFRDGVQIATVRAGVTSFEDDDWDAGAIYRYTVRAYDSLGDSADSNVAFVTVNVRR